jgi:hypothetical protein
MHVISADEVIVLVVEQFSLVFLEFLEQLASWIAGLLFTPRRLTEEWERPGPAAARW